MLAVVLAAAPPLARPLMTLTAGETARPVPSQGDRCMAVYAPSERANVGTTELQPILRRRSEALSKAARAGPMLAPSPLQRKARWLLFLTHSSFVWTPFSRASPATRLATTTWARQQP